MWKILVLLVFCALLGPSQSPKPGVKCAYGVSELQKNYLAALKRDGTLKRHFDEITIADIEIRGLLSLLGTFAIVDVEITAFKLKHFPNTNCAEIKLELRVHVLLKLLGILKVFYISAYADLSVSVNFCYTNYLGGSFDILISDCLCLVLRVQVDLLDGLLSASAQVVIQNRITADLTAKVCGIILKLLNVLKLHLLASLNVKLALGPYGTFDCHLSKMPVMDERFLGVSLKVVIYSHDGVEHTLPNTGVTIIQPTLSNHYFCQAIDTDLLKLVLIIYFEKFEQELTCTPDNFAGAAVLRLTILGLIPAGTVAPGLLYLKVHSLTNVVVRVGANKLTVEVTALIDVYTKAIDGTIVLVLRIRCVITFSVQLSVSNSRLKLTIFISKLVISLVSSAKGIVQISSLQSHCNDFLTVVILPALNARLDYGFPIISYPDTAIIGHATYYYKDCLHVCY